MKQLLGGLLALQVATLALLAWVLLREPSSESSGELAALRHQISGALHQQQQVTLYLDDLRGQLQHLLTEQQGLAGDQSPAVASSESPETSQPRDLPPLPENTPFPEAARRFQAVKATFQQRETAAEADNSFLQPFDQKLDEQRVSLLRLGTDVLHWIHHEIRLQPYHDERDPVFLAYLLDEILPELSGADAEACFELARDALVKVTNENSVRQAAARTLKKIDDRRWVNEYLAVISKGGQRKRDISLRVSLLDVFLDNPRPAIVPVTEAFLDDPRFPSPLRIKSAAVLAAQESASADTTLKKVLFEDAHTDLRMHSLDALYRRWAGRDDDQLETLLEEVAAADPEQMQSQVRNKASSLLAELTGESPVEE